MTVPRPASRGRTSSATWGKQVARSAIRDSTKKAALASFPGTLAEQAQAVRAALAAHNAPADAAALAKRFKGARAARIAEILDTLASLGQTRRLEDGRYLPL